MLYRAAVACADSMTPEERAEGRTFPKLERIRDVSVAVASAVIDEGFRANLNVKLQRDKFPSSDAIEAFVRDRMWNPDYSPLVDPSPRH
mmetsp:Transcript_10398/g.26407  ORF Transcript_10398/g.26407 Transcript_10398/m.26407 type:complete len:89 (+) Transcript_10398:3-269(+)